MSDSPADLSDLRRDLDQLDRQIVKLIAARFRVTSAVAREKAGSVGDIRDPDRERQVLAEVEQVARAENLNVNLVRRIYSELLRESVSRQVADIAGGRGDQVRVAFQGVEHGFGYLAAQKFLSGRSDEGELTAVRTYRAALDALHKGDVDIAVLPIENTAAGSINEVYDLLREDDISIVGEETWKVDHCLAGVADVPMPAVTRVFSDLEGLEQCSTFVQALPNAAPAVCFDASDAMRVVAAGGDPTQVAIGSSEAAEANGLTVLRRGIANQDENYTRFVVLARRPVAVDLRAPCKTSLILVTRHEQGALLRCLQVLSSTGHSMTKLESRPRPGRPWEYMFFLDFEGNIADPQTVAALDDLRTTALHLKVLGSYPAKATKAEAQPGTAPSTVEVQSSTEVLEAVSGPVAATSKHYKLAGRAMRTTDTEIPVGGFLIGGDGFVVMAGPCSVESAEQIQATARAVRDAGAQVLRGGVFKPRTSPYAFQGLAWEGVDLLAAAGRSAGMPIISEVMAVEQVRRMADIVDILQVGTRNMQNFDLLRELGKVDRPVLLKRGLSSTIEEWLSAAEYILAQGNQQVILCERGIRTFETSTRNTLDLSAVVVLRERTHLPVIVDPSHGTGNRRYVAAMSRAARAVGAHGLLIEVHPDPDTALSDADQSLSFSEFRALMRTLKDMVPAADSSRAQT